MNWTCLLLLTCCGAEPIFDAEPAHPWNQLRDVFYSHKFSTGEVYRHKSAFEPPWSKWAPFYNDEKFHARVIELLDAFLQQTADQVEQQPPVRRALLLRDLWPVFDAQTLERQDLTETGRGRRAELRRRLAKVMRRLELSEDEIKHLPDNFQSACKQGRFPTAFDAASPDTAFLPPDLFDAEGPWVPFSFREDTVGALQHVQVSMSRTVFVPLMKLPGGRKETLDFLEQLSRRRSETSPPKGTLLALVRRTVLPTADAKLSPTALTESLQLIVVEPPDDQRFKFVMDRANLLAGGSGLRAVSKDEPVDAYAFESGGLHPHHPKYDADGEVLVFGRWAGPPPKGTPSLGHCFACHGRTVGSNLFANTDRSGRAEKTTFDNQVRLILSQKESSYAWGMYQALRE